jgi:hypothetical protein
MATISYEPDANIVYAYGPINYEIFLTQSDTNLVRPALEVEVRINGVPVGTKFFPATAPDPISIPGLDFYRFQFGVEDVVQLWFEENGDTLPAFCSLDNMEPATAMVQLYLYDWYSDPLDPCGLQKQPTPQGTQLIEVINGYPSETSELHAEAILYQPSLPSYVGFLTDQPDNKKLCLDDCDYLFVHGFYDMGTEVKTYDSSGVLLETGYFFHTDNPIFGGQQAIHSIPVGPNQLVAQTYDNGDITTMDGVSYYEVTGGFYLGVGLFSPITVARRYYAQRNCCRAYTIVFLNRYGVYDYMQVRYQEEEDFVVESESYAGRYERVFTLLDDPPTPPAGLPSGRRTPQRAGNRLQSRARTTYTFYLKNVRAKEAEWIKQCLSSVDGYVIRNDENRYLPVEFQPGSFKLRDRRNRRNTIVVQAIRSDVTNSQLN